MRLLAFAVCAFALSGLPAFAADAPKPKEVHFCPGDVAWKVDSVKTISEIVIPDLFGGGGGGKVTIKAVDGYRLLQFSLRLADAKVGPDAAIDLSPSGFELAASHGGQDRLFGCSAVTETGVEAMGMWAHTREGTTMTVYARPSKGKPTIIKVVFSVPADFKLSPGSSIHMMRSVPLPDGLKAE